MTVSPEAAHLFAVVARLGETVERSAHVIVAAAYAARQLGATADVYRTIVSELDRQADSAEGLLFGQAVETLRAAAAESRLIADALDVIESRAGM